MKIRIIVALLLMVTIAEAQKVVPLYEVYSTPEGYKVIEPLAEKTIDTVLKNK